MQKRSAHCRNEKRKGQKAHQLGEQHLCVKGRPASSKIYCEQKPARPAARAVIFGGKKLARPAPGKVL